MRENNELERSDLAIDSDMEVDCDIGQEILAYVETWFDVDRKFGTHTAEDDRTWLNLYARYNPFVDTLQMECVISSEIPEENQSFDYEPTASEAQLVKDLIAEKIRQRYNQSPIEFCEEAMDESITLGGQA